MDQNLGFLYNRKLAKVVMIVIIVLATLFGTWKSLNAFRREAEVLFWGSPTLEGTNIVSVNDDIETKTGYASNLVLMSERYLNQEDTDALSKAIDTLSKAKTPYAKYAANESLNKITVELFTKFSAQFPNMKPNEAKAVQSVYTDMTAQDDRILNSGYNEKAQEFNKKLSQFPANIFGRLTGITPLEYYAVK